MIEAACWSHGRRKFFELAQLVGAPLAVEAVHRIDPRAWLADVLARIGDHPASRLDQLLPWN